MSTKTAIVMFTDDQHPTYRGRMIHALHLAHELKSDGHEVRLIFAGRSVSWIPKFLHNEGHHKRDKFVRNNRALFEGIRDNVVACQHSAKRFEVDMQIEKLGIPLEGVGDRELASLGKYVKEGFQLVTM